MTTLADGLNVNVLKVGPAYCSSLADEIGVSFSVQRSRDAIIAIPPGRQSWPLTTAAG